MMQRSEFPVSLLFFILFLPFFLPSFSHPRRPCFRLAGPAPGVLVPLRRTASLRARYVARPAAYATISTSARSFLLQARMHGPRTSKTRAHSPLPRSIMY
ncbi:hypothetical protein C8J57DRAFT_1293011 [Mycena rebaudengoi]|nr:hypothetical protein C8J57DRAFT_1293011 [Mycena rebaudengoi]